MRRTSLYGNKIDERREDWKRGRRRGLLQFIKVSVLVPVFEVLYFLSQNQVVPIIENGKIQEKRKFLNSFLNHTTQGT